MSSVPLFAVFIKKSIAFDEVMDNAYGMIATADLVIVPHSVWGHPNEAQCWVAVGIVLLHVTAAPLLPGPSPMAHSGNAFPPVLPLDLSGSLVV